MTPSDRRIFIGRAVAFGGSMLVARSALAADAPMVAESDPQAVALGYRGDTKKVDRAKYPKHDTSQHCGTCQLYQGKAGDAAGPCPLFAGKRVAVQGWCSAWVKKA